MQALYERDRTGECQFVDTSIIYAAMLNTSYTYLRADGSEPDRPRLDAGQHGLGAGYRLYETAAGWQCLALPGHRHWQARDRALRESGRGPRGGRLADARFVTPEARRASDRELAALLGEIFR